MNKHRALIPITMGIIVLGSILGIYIMAGKLVVTEARAASRHIINGRTPDDTDDKPCSESELIAYVDKIKKDISTKWQPPKGFEDRSVTVVFTVRQKGTIEEPKVVESSGSQAVDQTALAALTASSPLAPLPKGAPESIQIRYVFSWHITRK